MDRRKQVSELPDTHKAMRGPVFRGVDDSGRNFDVQVSEGRRRAGSGELVKAQIGAMRRGRPLTASDMYVPETRIDLRIDGQSPWQVESTANGGYRAGRHYGRTLRELVETVLSRSPVPVRPSGP